MAIREFPITLERECFSAHRIHSEKMHWHDHFELTVVESGSLCCTTPQESFRLDAGDVCFINRHQLHQLKPEGDLEGTHLVLMVNHRLLSQNVALYETFLKPMLNDATFRHIRFSQESDTASHLREQVSRIGRALDERKAGFPLELLSALYDILQHLYQVYASDRPIHRVDPDVVTLQTMIEYIDKNYASPLRLEDIAMAGAVSRSKAGKLFKEYTEMTPIQYLNDQRLEVSRELLRHTSLSAAAVAEQVGFSQQSYFNRLFLQQYGLTPLAYRKRARAHDAKANETSR